MQKNTLIYWLGELDITIAIRITEVFSYHRWKVFKEETGVLSCQEFLVLLYLKKQAASLVHLFNCVSLTPEHWATSRWI